MWQGFYAGGNLGIEWSHIDINRRDILILDDAGAEPSAHAPFGGKDIRSAGGFGGGQFGYNWQWGGGGYVLGLEVDLGGVAQKNERSFFGTAFDDEGFAGVAAAKVKINGGFCGDVTGGLGYTWGNALVYAKGGFAWLNAEISVSGAVVDDAGLTTTFRSGDKNTTLTGWTAGGGLEYLLNSNWSLKAEYMYYDFGGSDLRYCNDGVNDFKVNDKNLDLHTIKLGFNYFFHPPIVPLK
jgi:outer membrane immunogenic protein